MPQRPAGIATARTLALIAVCALALVAFRPGPMGFRLAVDRGGVSFLLKASAVKLAFDIGRSCSKSDTRLGVGE